MADVSENSGPLRKVFSVLVSVVLGAVAVGTIYWLDPSGVQDVLHHWRSDISSWWNQPK
jgi:hypothetical protein